MSAGDRRAKILEMLRSRGVWGFTQTRLAEIFGVTKQTISKDYRRLMENVNFADIKPIVFSMRLGYDRADKECWQAINKAENLQERLAAVATLVKVSESHTRFLESYGLKAPPQTQQTNIQFNMALVMDQAKQCREDEEKREIEWEAEMERRKRRMLGQQQNSDTQNA